MDTPLRRARLKRSVEKLLNLINTEAPDSLIARECASVFRHAIAVFEQLVGDVFTNWLIRGVRVNCHQCADCGGELDVRVAGPPRCGTCNRATDVDVLKHSLSDGEDPIEFDITKLE